MSQEQRTLPTQDIVEIQQLYARQSQALDLGNPKDWAACFMLDGTFSSPTYGKTIVGREALEDFAEQFAQENATAKTAIRHWTNALLLEVDAEGGVQGRCYALIVSSRVGSAPVILRSVVFHDRLVKQGATWRFQSRVVTRDS